MSGSVETNLSRIATTRAKGLRCDDATTRSSGSSATVAEAPPPPCPGEYPPVKEEQVEKAQSRAAGGSTPHLEQAREQSIVHMPPPSLLPVRKRVIADPYPIKPGPPNVLQEEDYSEALSLIIERDFFPDLPLFRAQHLLLRARLAGDSSKVREAEFALMNLPRPTPVGTPMGTPSLTPGGAFTPAVMSSPAMTNSVAGATPLHGDGWDDTPLRDDSSLLRSDRTQSAAAALAELAARGGVAAGIRAANADAVAAAAARPPKAAPVQPVSVWECDDDLESVNSRSQALEDKTLLRRTNGKDVRVDLSTCRLDDFQRLFTSEDNSSFEDLMRKDMAKLRYKERYMENIEEEHNAKHDILVEAIANGCIDPDENVVMCNEFRARNQLFFKKNDLPVRTLERPRVDFTNTRFTTKQQVELDGRLDQAIFTRKLRDADSTAIEQAEEMAQSGHFSLSALKGSGIWKDEGSRVVAGRFEGSPMLKNAGPVRGYDILKTPMFSPGEGGLSPLMTYGRIASTPSMLDEDVAPSFRIAETSDRELAAEKLRCGTTQQKRDNKQQTKTERLRALGIPVLTPSDAGTPASRATGTPRIRTPGSIASSKIVTPASPIGQLLHRAKRMAQQGGKLRIASSTHSDGGSAHGTAHGKSRITPAAQTRTPWQYPGKIRDVGIHDGAAAVKRRIADTDVRHSSERQEKRARREAQESALPASITDGLLLS